MRWIEIYALLADIEHIKTHIFPILVPQNRLKNADFEIKSTKIDVCLLVGPPETKTNTSDTQQSVETILTCLVNTQKKFGGIKKCSREPRWQESHHVNFSKGENLISPGKWAMFN